MTVFAKTFNLCTCQHFKKYHFKYLIWENNLTWKCWLYLFSRTILWLLWQIRWQLILKAFWWFFQGMDQIWTSIYIGLDRKGQCWKQLEKRCWTTWIAEFRVVMTSTSSHNGPVFHYKALIAIIILAVAAILGPHHRFMSLLLVLFHQSWIYMVSKKHPGIN